MSLPAILQQLGKDHANVARLLDLVDYQLYRYERGQPLDLDLLKDILRYVVEYQDVYHHPREDALFARVAARAPEPVPELDELEHEHVVLADRGAQLYRQLARASRGETTGDTVSSLLADYAGLLREHMSKESSSVFPLAQVLLFDEDWRDIDEALEIRADPLFGPAVETTYRSLLRRMSSRKGS